MTAWDLRPLGRATRVQFAEPLSARDYERLAGLLRRHPEASLRAYAHYGQPSTLDFLEHFPFLKRLEVDLFDLTDITGLQFLPDDLVQLSLGQTRTTRFSLRVLEKFTLLQNLYIDGHRKDISAIAGLRALRSLTLRSISVPELDFVTPLHELRSFDLKLGGTKHLDALAELPNLRYLEIWMVRGLSDLSIVAELPRLRFLFLQALRNVKSLPDLRGAAALEWLHLETMKGMTDVVAISSAPRLKDLWLLDMPNLPPKSLEVLVGHQTLRSLAVALGSSRRNQAARTVLDLPRPERGKAHVRAQAHDA